MGEEGIAGGLVLLAAGLVAVALAAFGYLLFRVTQTQPRIAVPFLVASLTALALVLIVLSDAEVAMALVSLAGVGVGGLVAALTSLFGVDDKRKGAGDGDQDYSS